MKKVKVAVVDDQEEIRNGFAFLLNSSEEFQCVGSYNSAEELLSGMKKNMPDVVIMDIGLPGMSGVECCSEININHPDVRVMMCTIYEDDERLFGALRSGASGYILKRSSSAILLDALRELKNGGAPMTPLIGRKVLDSFRKQDGIIARPQMKFSRDFDLSKREIEIMELLSAGFRNKEIAEKLYISNHTVRSHIYHIYEKLHVKSRVEALNKLSGKL